MPDISGESGTGSAGTPAHGRTVPLSGWFGTMKFASILGIVGACSVGYVSYLETGSTDWLLVDYADRLYPWADYCGIPGGIPDRTTIYAALGVPGQAPSYAQSVTAAQLNAALLACPPGQVVLLYPGTYTFGSIVTAFSNLKEVTLRGSGPGQTIIHAGVSTVFRAEPSLLSEAGGRDIASGYTRGSQSITLATPPSSYFQVGGIVAITENRSPNKFAPGIGTYNRTNNTSGLPSLNSERVFNFVTRITSVSQVPPYTVGLACPIPFDFTASLSPRAYTQGANPSFPSLVGIEDMTFEDMSDPILYWISDRCWWKNLEFRSCAGCDIGHIRLYNAVQPEIRRCYINNVDGWPSQNEGAGFGTYYGTCNGLFIDNITNRTSAGFFLAGNTANAYLHNYSRDCSRGGTPVVFPMFFHHGGHAFMNLIEGNIGPQYCPDGYHGSASHDTQLRNNWNGLCTGRTNDRWLQNLSRGCYYENVIGNVLGDPSWNPTYYQTTPPSPGHDEWTIWRLGYPNSGGGSMVPETEWLTHPGVYPDPAVAATLLRHGNYDYHSDAVVWDPTIPEHTIPNSLFYSSKPAFFGSLNWPNVDPAGPVVGSNPAKARWDRYVISGVLSDLFADET